MKKKAIIGAVLLFIVGVSGFTFYSNASLEKEEVTDSNKIITVKKGTVLDEISGAGVVYPIERFDITPLVNGKIVEAPFEEGQMVKKGDILYRFDATTVEAEIKKAANTVLRMDITSKEIRDNIDKSVVYAPASGRLINFNVKVNDVIGTGKIGEILDESYQIARVRFNKIQLERVEPGQSAIIISADHMDSISGIVSKVYTRPIHSGDGSLTYEVDIKISGLSSLSEDNRVLAKIGEVTSTPDGLIVLPETVNVASLHSGRVTKVYVSNHEEIKAGQKLFELDTESYYKELERNTSAYNDAKESLESMKKKLEDYYITSPIDGVVLKKSFKAGDTVNFGSNSGTLMVIANKSKVKFEMKIDEMDINKIKVGQPVKVKAIAVPGKEFVGRVSYVANYGTSTDGVSSFMVQVIIDDPGELKSGMNITAKTVIGEKKDVLIVPLSAMRFEEEKTFVKVLKDKASSAQDVAVQIGIKDNKNAEIKFGLKEGDLILVPESQGQGSVQQQVSVE